MFCFYFHGEYWSVFCFSCYLFCVGVVNVCVCSCMHSCSCIWWLKEDVRSPSPLREALPSFWLGWWPASPSDPFVSTYIPSTAFTGSHAMSCSVHRCWGSELRTSGFPASGLPCWAVSMFLLALPLVFVRVILVYFCRNLLEIVVVSFVGFDGVIRVVILSPLVAVSSPGRSFRYIVTLMIL